MKPYHFEERLELYGSRQLFAVMEPFSSLERFAVSHRPSSPVETSDTVASEQDRQRLAAIETQIAGFIRNLADPDGNTCVPALEETIAYLRDAQSALLTSAQIAQGSSH